MDSGVLMHLLEVSIVLVFFVNKVLILIGKRFGWMFGIIAASLAILYFYSVGKIPLAGMQIGVLAASVYGFLPPSKKHFLEAPVRWILLALLLVQAVFVFNGSLVLLKSLVASGILLGNYFLARSNFRIGWPLLGVSNIIAAYLGYSVEHIFFADFQMATAIVASIGMISHIMKD